MWEEQLQIKVGIIRHGQSTANVQGHIVSSLSKGGARVGLTKLGREQVRASIRAHRSELTGRTSRTGAYGGRIVVVSSPFLRTMETAQVAVRELTSIHGVGVVSSSIPVCHDARERYFGWLDGQNSDNYQHVWDLDRIDPAHRFFRNESVNDVRVRMSRLISALSKTYPGATVLIATHGDTGQIANTLFEDVVPSQHHAGQQPLGNADIWWFN